MTVHVTTVSQMDATGTDSCKLNYSNSLTSLTFAAHNNNIIINNTIIITVAFAVPLAVGSILVAILCVAAGIGCLVGYRYCRLKRMDLARIKIMKDLEEHHSSKTMSFNG